MKLLDLFCKAGGAAAGYVKAGFEVVGVDIEPQPNYPFSFIQADALKILEDLDFISQFDIIHASPPCQFYSKCKYMAKNKEQYLNTHQDLIPVVRELLIKTGKPYVIENVEGSPLINPISLSGTQFEHVYTQRKRLFESNVLLQTPSIKPQKRKTPRAGDGIGEDGFISICGSGGVRGLNSKQIILYWGFALGGIDWMSRDELAEAIPPAYTEFIGRQLLNL